MNRWIFGLVSLLVIGSFSTASDAQPRPKIGGRKVEGVRKPLQCPAGTTLVKGYKKPDGTVVKAYCRHA